jgi:hypothetical protein
LRFRIFFKDLLQKACNFNHALIHHQIALLHHGRQVSALREASANVKLTLPAMIRPSINKMAGVRQVATANVSHVIGRSDAAVVALGRLSSECD